VFCSATGMPLGRVFLQLAARLISAWAGLALSLAGRVRRPVNLVTWMGLAAWPSTYFSRVMKDCLLLLGFGGVPETKSEPPETSALAPSLGSGFSWASCMDTSAESGITPPSFHRFSICAVCVN
uniref:Uncharacterized protein n=1 Tax=Gadus morhua TaxID=8049 RepID=A0A8C5BNK7_GADMO